VAKAQKALVATVVVPTFNGEKYLRRILDSLKDQDVDGAYDVLVIDSGSSDGTLDIVRDFPDVRLHEIPNAEFGHGRTRNLGARLSRGEFTAFLTHDAIPLSASWLRRLLEPMLLDDSIVAVTGKQIPRPGCLPLLKYEMEGVFIKAGVDYGVTVYSQEWAGDDPLGRDRAAFYSDVNSAARTSILLTVVPYRDVPYAEDQMFGRDVLAAGLKKAYAPAAAVEHSNDLTRKEYGRRVFDETLGLRSVGLAPVRLTRRGVLARVVRGSLIDALRIAGDRELSSAARIRSWLVNPPLQAKKWVAIRRALLADPSGRAQERHSLEARRRGGAPQGKS